MFSRKSPYIFFCNFSPEAFGVVTGCMFLVTLFLYIPIPFSNTLLEKGDFPHDEVKANYVIGQNIVD